MSVRLMSAVFEYKFPMRVDYVSKDRPFKRDENGKAIEISAEQVDRNHATTGSTCKAVLLALADHANDDGKGAYPSTTTICVKTNLTKPTVISGLLALRYWGFINFVGTSPRETNNYDIIPETLVKPFDQVGKATLPVMVNQVYQGGKAGLPEPSLTIHEPPITREGENLEEPKPADPRFPDWNMLHGLPISEQTPEEQFNAQARDGANMIATSKPALFPYAMAFILETKLVPTPNQVKEWRKQMTEWLEYKPQPTPAHVILAVREMKNKGLAIPRPASLYNLQTLASAPIREAPAPVEEEKREMSKPEFFEANRPAFMGQPKIKRNRDA